MSLVDMLPDSVAVMFSEDYRTIDLLNMTKRAKRLVRNFNTLAENGEVFDYTIKQIENLLIGYDGRFSPYFKKTLENLQGEAKSMLGYNCKL